MRSTTPARVRSGQPGERKSAALYCLPAPPPRAIPALSRRGEALVDRVTTAFLEFAARAAADVLGDPDEDHDDLPGRVADIMQWAVRSPLRRENVARMSGGLEVLGVGATRIVIALDLRRVLKVEFNYDYADGSQNLRERDRWEHAAVEDAWRLAPVLAACPAGYWLVMARTSPLTAPLMEGQRAEMDEALRRVRDINPMNVGLLCGRVVLHDYGD